MAKCVVCNGSGVCQGCKGRYSGACGCWPPGKCRRCHGSGKE